MFITIVVALAFMVVGCLFGVPGALFGFGVGLCVGAYIGLGECEGPVYRFFFAPRQPKNGDVPTLTDVA